MTSGAAAAIKVAIRPGTGAFHTALRTPANINAGNLGSIGVAGGRGRLNRTESKYICRKSPSNYGWTEYSIGIRRRREDGLGSSLFLALS